MAEIGGIGDMLDSLTNDLVATDSLVGGCDSDELGSGIKEITDSPKKKNRA